jgi:hypothetical protein
MTVVIENHLEYTTDAFSLLSSRSLGHDHVIMAYKTVQDRLPELRGSQFAIVATEDDTIVWITPTAPVGPHQPGVAFAITLAKGQTYQARATAAGPLDFTGTYVVSSKPVAVFGGHRCAGVDSSDGFPATMSLNRSLQRVWQATIF